MENSAFPPNWKKAQEIAIQACRVGREILLTHLGKLENVEKKFQAGLVSEADRLSEKAIIDYLRRHYPQSEVLGEESTADGIKVQEGHAGPRGRWILDPLDGTTNYIHRFHVFCISLGLEVDGDLKVAVIDVPMLGETYTAIRGEGAFVNGRPLRVSQTLQLEDSLLATGFFAENKPALKEQLALFTDLVDRCRGIRRAGAAAYDLCMVARGVFDGFWEKNLKPWDTAAGQLLVEEAGGVVLTYEGDKANPYLPSIVAGNPQIVPLILERFRAARSRG